MATLCAALFAATPLCAAADSQETPDAQSLFSQARDALSDMSYPAALTYDVVVRASVGGRTRADRYAASLQPGSGDFRVSKFSESEQANPYVPHGTNVTYGVSVAVNSGNRGVGATGDNATLSTGGSMAKERPVEVYAIPELSPLFTFGLHACAARRVRAAHEIGGLRVIGGVTSSSRRYRAVFVARETIDGSPVVHLSLIPLIDPARDRLREIWLSPDNRIVQVRLSGNFTSSSESQIPWTVRFADIDGASYISSESAEAPIRRGAKTYDAVEIRFENIRDEKGWLPPLSFSLPADLRGLNVIQEPPESPSRSRC